jgi:hypothetical protein
MYEIQSKRMFPSRSDSLYFRTFRFLRVVSDLHLRDFIFGWFLFIYEHELFH